MKTPFYAFALLIFPLLFPQHAEAQNNSLLWEISGNGLSSPSYLYGTMHVADKRAFKFSKSVMPSFESCEAYAMELNPEEANPMALMEMMKLEEGTTLQSMFSEEQWNKLDGYFQEKYKQPLSTYNDFSPFFVYSLVIQTQSKNNMAEAVDLHFFSEAKKAEMDLHGLETAEEQISAINSMKPEDQANMLLEAIEGKGDGKKAMKKMLKVYMKGDLDKLVEMSEDAEMGDEFESNLIVKRNHNMAERLQPLIKEKSTFVAVGALHLPGDEGVIQLLRNDGYQVKALK